MGVVVQRATANDASRTSFRPRGTRFCRLRPRSFCHSRESSDRESVVFGLRHRKSERGRLGFLGPEKSKAMDKQVVSRQRVLDHGEVLTSNREVNAMLDLVKHETERIESRFLEPACGNGNFLTAILERKLRVVENRYGKSQLDYERNAILAISSIYGIDILEDNVQQCRHRLFGVFEWNYSRLFKYKAKNKCREAVRFVLELNIIWGDALTLKTVGDEPESIVFSEWSPLNGSMLKRRDFTFRGLLTHEGMKELPLFSDLGEDVFIPRPVKEYPPAHFLEIAHVQQQ